MYRSEIGEKAKTSQLWVRRKRGNQRIVCSGCGGRSHAIHKVVPWQVWDLPCLERRETVVVELYRMRCPDCGPRLEKTAEVLSTAPFSKRFEDVVGQACESAAARRVAHQFGLAESTVRAIDLRYLERRSEARRKPAHKQMGVDVISPGKTTKLLTLVSNLELGEPLWFGQNRKKETLDEFFRTQLRRDQHNRIEAACVDMWAPNYAIVYDKSQGLLSYYRVNVRLGVVEAMNGNIRTVLKRGRGYKSQRYLLLKVQCMAATKTEFIAFRKAAYNGHPVRFSLRV